MPTNGHKKRFLSGFLDVAVHWIWYRMCTEWVQNGFGNDTSTGCGLLLVETRAAEVVVAGWVGNFVPARETWCSSCHRSKSSRRGDEEMKESSNYYEKYGKVVSKNEQFQFKNSKVNCAKI